ncbi:MAG: universal stress protein [Muribaculaceae bacterium]|nr:universal stress protein [Muribaculaceae bacterium]
MIDVDDFITLVIHTPGQAQNLKNILESHGMEVKLEDFVSYKSPVAVAQRVKIHPRDLLLAIKIIESGKGYSPAIIDMKMAGMSGNLLIPVDFSESSKLAVDIGFKLAKRMGVHPVIMHSYVAPVFTQTQMMGPAVSDDSIVEAEESESIRNISASRLSKFKNRVVEWQKSGEIPEVKFSVSLQEGVAEEAIIEYCKIAPPELVVMSTRGVNKKEEELIGSVTAEVLDSCRVPLFTVPDNCTIESIEGIRNLLMICNLDQHDIITIDALMRMFDYPECSVTLVPSVQRKSSHVKEKLEALKSFFNSNYPTAKFETHVFGGNNLREDIDKIISESNIQLLIIPNKKTNIFSRIFRPTLAHKCLFERDMPMLVIPV